MKHVITAYPFPLKKDQIVREKLYIISKKAKKSKTTTRIYILGNVRIVAIVNKSKF